MLAKDREFFAQTQNDLVDVKSAERLLQPNQALQLSDSLYHIYEHGHPPRDFYHAPLAYYAQSIMVEVGSVVRPVSANYAACRIAKAEKLIADGIAPADSR